MNNLIQYLKNNKIYFEEVDDRYIDIDNKRYFLVLPEEGKLFSEDFILMADRQDCDRYVYNFGGNWYWEEKSDYDSPKLNQLKYIGRSQANQTNQTFLGVRGAYEILNGSRLYEDWVKKAKFLELISLGICEKNTLAGTLKFQLACQKENIKPIIGATYTVFRESEDYRYDIKLYVQNETGWNNLLVINKEVNVLNNKFVTENRLLELLDGLFVVLDPKSIDFEKLFPLDLSFQSFYYQLDTVEYVNNDRDKWYLENLKKFVKSSYKPVSIIDSFYLDKEDNHIKNILNSISSIKDYDSNNQYFKDKEDYFSELEVLFNKEDDSLYGFYQKSLFNEMFIANNCNFVIETGNKHLPKYIMTDEEKAKYSDNIDMFWSLIEDGLRSKNLHDSIDRYLTQIQKEYDIIDYGNLQDYFLINWEQIEWCKKNNIMTGLARGSAAGFQSSYLLDVTKIDPFDYDLIAERFLTKERAKHKIADIDIDHEQLRRDEVKQHLINKYGFDQCCSVGTYTTFQIKGGLKDLARVETINFSEVNYISSLLDKECKEWKDIFSIANKKPRLKNFIQKHANIINDLLLVLNSKKSTSIHASAFIITPSDKTIYEWMPVRIENKNDENILVSEWEGVELEEAGFLKQDILGLLQLDKFHNIIDLVKDKEIDIYNIPLNDSKVFQYFTNGWNNDVFQFGTKGLTEYCKQLKPTNINDLIAAVSLYRPGAMDNNFHNEYILRKEGKREVEYYSGVEEITKNTYGLLVYQEQVMQICQKLANFDLAETDDIRKCLHEDTLMWTKDGYRKIKDLPKKIHLFTFSEKEYLNKFNKTCNVFSNGERECVKILFDGGRELICTKDHKIFTNNGWKQAQHLTDMDFVIHEVEEKYGTLNIDKDKLYLIVALITEGYLCGTSKTFTNKDIDEINEFKLRYNRFFGTDINKEYLGKNDVVTLHVSKECFDKLDLNEVKSDEHELPEYFLSLNKNNWLFVLGKLIDFDGYVNDLGYIYYCSKSKKLIDQIHFMMENIGGKANIVTRFKKEYNANYYEVYIGDSRDLVECHNKLKPFCKKIRNFKGNICDVKNYSKYIVPHNLWHPIIENLINNSGYKRNELINVSGRYFNKNITIDVIVEYLQICGRSKELEFYASKNIYWNSVKSIVDVGKQKVYDFTMGYGVLPQAYANGILVHNSLGKKKADVLEMYKNQFIKNSIKNGYNENEMVELWNAMEKFSGYSFNLSHAAAYAITGYISQWLKVHYPIEFWSTAFQFAKEDDIANYISEINLTGDIKVMPADINKSRNIVFTDFETKTIYWPLESIKQCGEKAAQQIIELRDKDGEYFSFEEFLSRNKFKGSKVNKSVIENLVMSGAFDETDNVRSYHDRYNLIEFYRTQEKVKVDKDKDLFSVNEDLLSYDWWWTLQQKRLSGITFFDYNYLLDKYIQHNVDIVPIEDFQNESYSDKREKVKVGGYIVEVEEKTNKKGTWCRILLESNYTFIWVTMWSEQYEQIKSMRLPEKEKSILLLSGEIIYDSYKQENILLATNDTEILILE